MRLAGEERTLEALQRDSEVIYWNLAVAARIESGISQAEAEVLDRHAKELGLSEDCASRIRAEVQAQVSPGLKIPRDLLLTRTILEGILKVSGADGTISAIEFAVARKFADRLGISASQLAVMAKAALSRRRKGRDSGSGVLPSRLAGDDRAMPPELEQLDVVPFETPARLPPPGLPARIGRQVVRQIPFVDQLRPAGVTTCIECNRQFAEVSRGVQRCPACYASQSADALATQAREGLFRTIVWICFIPVGVALELRFGYYSASLGMSPFLRSTWGSRGARKLNGLVFLAFLAGNALVAFVVALPITGLLLLLGFGRPRK